MNHSASLIVITDDQHEKNPDLSAYYLTLFSRKLKILDIFLRKIFFITKLDTADVVRQLRLLLETADNDVNNNKSVSQSWILMTTTKPSNDFLMDRVLSENQYHSNGHASHCNVTGLDHVFMLKSGSFHADMFKLMNHLLISRDKFTSLHQSKADMEKLLSFKSQDLCLKQYETNYSDSTVDITVQNKEILSQVIPLVEPCLTLMGNKVNADSFLYEFDHFASLVEPISPDLTFLSSKIDSDSFRLKLKSSIQVIEKALSDYDTNQLCVSFNGGKDCCVVLYLFYAVCLRLNARLPLKVLLIQIEHQFDEINFFVDHVIKSFYGPDLLEFIVFDEKSTKSLKDCLSELKVARPVLNGILMGTRRTDSAYFASMSAFAPTDGDWPSFMRINPILEWTYSEIWYFMRKLKLPYCTLYDRGYTSVDNTLNTVPNQDLVRDDGSFRPAFYLENQDAERKSRRKK
jgi:3'-phosphoadenosine 5'-phosphosulfate sulfotransferase (PAPS reductase)/FAD synthetase